MDSLTIPAGRPIFAAKVYRPPAPALGFSSPDEGDEAAPAAEVAEGYAGKGTYF
jgi:hypothetical protein